MKQPRLFLTVGLPGTGKTTAARQLEAEHGALRLTRDEWMKARYGPDNPASASDVIERRQAEAPQESDVARMDGGALASVGVVDRFSLALPYGAYRYSCG